MFRNQIKDKVAIDQQRELLVDALAAEQAKNGGLERSMAKLNHNQRLTGNDYRRLTHALGLAILTIQSKQLELEELSK